jgi:flagellar hook-associated protein 2
LAISSEVSGRRGELLIAAQGVDLGFATLSRAQDAVLTIGGDGAEQTLVITSPSNTVSDVVPGVKLNLLSISNDPVTIAVDRDVEPIIAAIEGFVEKYNAVIETIEESTQFNQDTLQRGPLLGDSTVSQVRTRLTRLMLRPFGGTDGSLSRSFSVGLRLGAGNRLEFDRERFEEAYERSPEDVEQLFATGESGFAAVIKETLEDMTRSFDGLITRKDEVLKDQQELLNQRIDGLNILLEAKRARLEAQFIGLESTLAALQDQQGALNGLAQLLT